MLMTDDNTNTHDPTPSGNSQTGPRHKLSRRIWVRLKLARRKMHRMELPSLNVERIPVEPLRRFVHLFLFRRYGGLSLPVLLILALVAYWQGSEAYRNLQLYYQEQMFQAVARADVIADICQSRSDMLWDECQTDSDPAERGVLSDRFAWAMMVSAGVLDPLTVTTPAELGELQGKDRPANAVYLWLKGDFNDLEPHKERGTGLLIQAATSCGGAFLAAAEPAANVIFSAYLGNLYQPTSDGSRWLNHELRKSLGLQPRPLQSVASERTALNADAENWLARWNPRDGLGLTKDGLYTFERACIWSAFDPENSVALEACSELPPESQAPTALLRKYLENSDDRRAVPDHVTDADLVALLLSAGSFLDQASNRFLPQTNRCQALTEVLANGGGEPPERADSDTQLAITNFEKMALYVAGRIRVSPEVKSAQFWLNIYTGHEQRLIFIVAIFGALCIVARMSIFLTLTLTRQRKTVLIAIFLLADLLVAISTVQLLRDQTLWLMKAGELNPFNGHAPGSLENTLLSLPVAWIILCAILAANLAFLLTVLGYHEHPADASKRDNDFDSPASSRWPIRLAVAILRAIGFIGTVRGIMLSLNGADAIVWAETVNERSTAISSLSADLGLAFATTLLALLGSALLTLLMAFEMAFGERITLRRHMRKD